MDREQALALVRKYTNKDITFRHLVATEGVMRALARHFNEDEDRWGFAGLWHDLDYDVTAESPDRHPYMGMEWLREEGMADEGILNAIHAHRDHEYATDLMSKSLIHADGVAGLVVAAALVRPEKSKGMKVSSLKKKLKEKSFAPGVERDKVRNVEEGIGLSLDEFMALSIEGLQAVAAEIDL
jgi:predicted hydrolase (HD superfamily)